MTGSYALSPLKKTSLRKCVFRVPTRNQIFSRSDTGVGTTFSQSCPLQEFPPVARTRTTLSKGMRLGL